MLRWKIMAFVGLVFGVTGIVWGYAERNTGRFLRAAGIHGAARKAGRSGGALRQPNSGHLYFINLVVWPSNSAIRQEDHLTHQGYNLIHWTQSGMTYWLVSELNLTESNERARLLKE